MAIDSKKVIEIALNFGKVILISDQKIRFAKYSNIYKV